MQLRNMSKKCLQIREHFSEYMDGEMSSAERLRIHEHVRECQPCSPDLDLYNRSLAALIEYDEETMPAAVHTFRLPRSTFVEVFPTIREEPRPITYGMLLPYLSALVLFFMVISTWVELEHHFDTQYNESNYVEVVGN